MTTPAPAPLSAEPTLLSEGRLRMLEQESKAARQNREYVGVTPNDIDLLIATARANAELEQRLREELAKRLIGEVRAEATNAELVEALKLSVKAMEPFAEASNELHPSSPLHGTTLDGIEVRAWHAVREAHRRAFAALQTKGSGR
jgi:hypothetical protein